VLGGEKGAKKKPHSAFSDGLKPFQTG